MNIHKVRVAIFGSPFYHRCSSPSQDVLRKSAPTAEVLKILLQMQAEIVIEKNFAEFLCAHLLVDVSNFLVLPSAEIEADYAISMGGDGTFLNTAAAIGNKQIPILGINTGRLGFLADVSPEEIPLALDLLVQRKCYIEQRSVIAVEKDGLPISTYPYALNEVAILKHDNSSLIEVTTCVGGELLANYMADGIIVCTPTGSTGYSLSVGGPIIEPRSGTFCISAVAPHSLSVRPVILCDDAEITLNVRSRSQNFLISIDGRSESFPQQTTISLRRAPYTVGVIKLMHKEFFDTMRNKMMWGMDHRF